MGVGCVCVNMAEHESFRLSRWVDRVAFGCMEDVAEVLLGVSALLREYCTQNAFLSDRCDENYIQSHIGLVEMPSEFCSIADFNYVHQWCSVFNEQTNFGQSTAWLYFFKTVLDSSPFACLLVYSLAINDSSCIAFDEQLQSWTAINWELKQSNDAMISDKWKKPNARYNWHNWYWYGIALLTSSVMELILWWAHLNIVMFGFCYLYIHVGACIVTMGTFII